MSIQVENNLKNTENKEVFEKRTHYVPCKIEDDGPANVKKYFEPYVCERDTDLTATFRGHPLDGTLVPLPEGYRAVVVTEAKRSIAENADRRFQVAGGFKDIVYWNWDKKTSKNDNLIRALDWVDIAEAEPVNKRSQVHNPSRSLMNVKASTLTPSTPSSHIFSMIGVTSRKDYNLVELFILYSWRLEHHIPKVICAKTKYLDITTY